VSHTCVREQALYVSNGLNALNMPKPNQEELAKVEKSSRSPERGTLVDK